MRVRPLLKQLPLLPGASLVDHFQRHRLANGVESTGPLLKLVSAKAGESIARVEYIVRSPNALAALEWVTGAPAGSLAAHLLTPVVGATCLFLRQGHHFWPEDVRSPVRQAVCPLCLEESGHSRATWEFVQAPVCVRHAVALVDECPECATAFTHSNPTFGSCGHCGFRLSRANLTGVDDATVHAARLVQEPSTLALGPPGQTEPISVEELAALLRLCTIPRLGEAVTHGLTHRAPALPLSRRLEALRNLSRAVDGRRIDSTRLRPILLQRWPYARLLPQEQQIQLLTEACRAVELARDVTRLVCQDRNQAPHPTAAEAFGSRIPRLTSITELQAFLGVDQELLMDAASSTRFALQLPEGEGFDMDDVLEVKRVLDARMQFDAVDAVLGVAGLSEQLVRLGILRPLRTGDGAAAIHAASVCDLMARLHEKVCPSLAAGLDPVPLARATELGLDIERVAWAVAQVIGGSLLAAGWEAPCSLGTLLVDGGRLRALAHWPQCEVHASNHISELRGPRPVHE